MKKKLLCSPVLLALVIILIVSCKKENSETDTRENLAEEKTSLAARQADLTNPPYDLSATLRGACNAVPSEGEDDEASGDCPVGHLKFRQDPDPEKIIDLDIKVHNLLPSHSIYYKGLLTQMQLMAIAPVLHGLRWVRALHPSQFLHITMGMERNNYGGM